MRSIGISFFWLGISQAVSAIGQLIGVRFLTNILSPSLFGEVNLMLGLVSLVTCTLFNPAVQAVFRYYPALATPSDIGKLKSIALRYLKKISLTAFPLILFASVILIAVGWLSFGDIFLILVLVLVDGIRLIETTIMNASMQHYRYGLWLMGEAWGRPLIAYLAVLMVGPKTEIVLAAFILTTITMYGLMHWQDNFKRNLSTYLCPIEDETINKFAVYCKPLIPVGLIGWVSGMGDRYFIGGFISIQDVGLYAAAFSLAHRPMLMLSIIAETTISPIYYRALSRNDLITCRKYIIIWFVIILSCGITMTLLISAYHHDIAALLIGSEFKSASYLMPWICAGYALLAISHIPNRICYANDATSSVLFVVTIGAFSAVLANFFFIPRYGIFGAAIAIPMYFLVQLTASTYLALKSHLNRNIDRQDIV